MRRDALFALALLAGSGCGHDATPAARPAVTTQAPRTWRVYDGELEILEVTDRPGPLVSTAPPPPDGTLVMHPFLSATALDAGHESQLRQLLQRSHSVDEFLQELAAAGFRVVAQ